MLLLLVGRFGTPVRAEGSYSVHPGKKFVWLLDSGDYLAYL
jgi:hypothetical protein